MCHSASELPGWSTPISRHRRQHRPFMSIKSFEQTQQVGRVTRYVVHLVANLFWLVCASQSSFVLARTLGTWSHNRRLLTHYRPREVRNSIYWCWKIHIDYRSKFSYRFISTISIIHRNTIANPFKWRVCWPWPWGPLYLCSSADGHVVTAEAVNSLSPTRG